LAQEAALDETGYAFGTTEAKVPRWQLS